MDTKKTKRTKNTKKRFKTTKNRHKNMFFNISTYFIDLCHAWI